MNKKILFTVIVSLLTVGNAQAAITAYTNQADFLAAISTMPIKNTVHFDSMPTGSIANGSTIDGITLYNNAGYDLFVDNYWDTTSPANYLGLDDGVDFAFMMGDILNMNFAHPMLAVGLYVTVDNLNDFYDTDFELRAGNGVAKIELASAVTLNDGYGYFLGILEDEPLHAFASAELWSDPAGAGIFYNVDDITTAVPIPGTFLLLWAGVTCLLFRKHRKLNA